MGKKNSLSEDIKKRFEEAARNTAIELNYLLETAYEKSVEQFYLEYTPRYYQRTGFTYYGSDLFNNKKYQEPVKHGNKYRAQINISSRFIPGEPYKKGTQDRPDKDWVFERTFIEGIHGHTEQERNKWGNNAWWKYGVLRGISGEGTVEQFLYFLKMHGRKNQYKNPWYKTKGYKTMKLSIDNHIRYFHFDGLPGSPHEMMLKYYKTVLCKKKNIDTIFLKYLNMN